MAVGTVVVKTTTVQIPVAQIQESKSNPRRHVDKAALAELTDSVRRLGILQPLLVRPAPNSDPPFGEDPSNGTFELVAGHRRLAAARAAGLERVPVAVRELSDIEVLEVQLVENLQRADLHPLEEAEGYQRLLTVTKMDAARIAEKVGRSVKYVYDRVKLLSLTKEAKDAFLEDRISAGHAILLARLKPADQKRAMDVAGGVLFQRERLLWHPDKEAEEDPVKTCSVRELQGWIDEHVRFDAKAPDPMLFPETASELERAKKVVPITYSHYISPEARDGRTYFPKSWRRADGEKNRGRLSKTCEHSVTGFVAAGPARGEAFAVCIAKEKCLVHWGSEIRARTKRAKTPGRKTAPRVPKSESAEEKALREALVQAVA